MLRNGYICLAAAILLAGNLFAARVADADGTHHVRLLPWQPAGPTELGVLVPVRLNDGRTLNLLLDSGAGGILLNARAARTQALDDLSVQTRFGGLGNNVPRTARLALAKRVTVGDLELENLTVAIAPDQVTRDADGIIGTNVFRDFRIRLDVRARQLSLEPFSDETPQTGTQAWAADHLLFVRAKVLGGPEGFFLIDTGSAVTTLAADVQWPEASSGAPLPLVGVSGSLDDARRLAPVHLRVGDSTVLERAPVAVNLDAVSRRNGLKVSGILGYSVLSRMPVTFNYRDGLVELGSR